MLSFFKKKKSETTFEPVLPFNIDYARDFHFLETMIEKYLTAESLKMGFHDVKVISDSDCIEMITRISQQAIEDMSDSYKKILLQYLTKEGFENFIVNAVTLQVIALSLKVNERNFLSKA